MIDNAINGNPIEQGFDESQLSALETKFASYLAMNRETKNQLEEEKKKISELVSDISHQTKTPLSNIILYSDLLSEANLGETENQYVSSLVNQTEKLNFLISSLVKTSRLETGIIELKPEINDVLEVVEAVINQGKGGLIVGGKRSSQACHLA